MKYIITNVKKRERKLTEREMGDYSYYNHVDCFEYVITIAQKYKPFKYIQEVVSEGSFNPDYFSVGKEIELTLKQKIRILFK